MNISVGQIWSKVSQFEFSGGCKKKKSIYSKYFICLAVPGLSCDTQHLPSSLWCAGSLVAAFRIFYLWHAGSISLTQGLNPGPLHWECELLVTGSLGKSQVKYFKREIGTGMRFRSREAKLGGCCKSPNEKIRRGRGPMLPYG